MDSDKKWTAVASETNNNTSKKSRQRQREPLSATPTDVFVKLPHLFVPFLGRVSLNRLFSVNREIQAAGRTVTLPWPEKRFYVHSHVYSVAFSPDGGLLVCGCSNGHTLMWNRTDGQCTLLTGHSAVVRSVTFSPNGKLLASASDDRTIRLWKIDDKSSKILESRNDLVSSVAFSPDGSTLAAGSFTGSVRLCNISDGRCTRTLRDDRMHSVYVVAWFEKTIASVGSGDMINLWNLSEDFDDDSCSPVSIQGHEYFVSAFSYSSDGRYFASGGGDDTVKLWNAADLTCAKVFSGHTLSVYSACFSPNGKILASASHDHSVRLWNVETADAGCISTLSRGYCSVSFSSDGRTLASGGTDQTVNLSDISS
jgi:WD40 repeat protein